MVEIDLTTLDCRKEDQLESLYLFTKDGFLKGAHIELRDRQDASSRFMLAALLLNNENVIGAIRRELRRVVDVLVDEDVIAKVMQDEVIKRDALEGPPAEQALKRVMRKSDRPLRVAKDNSDTPTSEVSAPGATPAIEPKVAS